MRTLLTLAIAMLLAQTLQAQILNPYLSPTVQTATLKEWWRADDNGYGVDGMTWLENFYNGAGALVISTPDGVQTWQLRYAWDTVNVFTWAGGSANIKVGDFNGDGLRDYLDSKGNIYFGTSNGQTPHPQPVSNLNGVAPYLIMDLNSDGKSDIVDFQSIGTTVSVTIGTDSMANSARKTYFIVGADSVHDGFMHAYALPNNDLRIVLRHKDWVSMKEPPYRKVISDGMRLVGLHWDQSLNSIKFSLLADTTWQTEDSNDVILTSQVTFVNDRAKLLLCTIIGGNIWQSNLRTFDLSEDTFKSKSSLRLDSVQTIVPLKYSLDNDSVASLCVVRSDSWNASMFRANTDSMLTKICNVVRYCPIGRAISIPKSVTRDRASFIAAGTYLLNGREKSALSFSSLVDTVSAAVEQLDDPALQVYPNPSEGVVVISISPHPKQSDQSGESMTVVITNTLGNEMLRERTSCGATIKLDCNAYPSGLYNVQLLRIDRDTGGSRVCLKRFMIQH